MELLLQRNTWDVGDLFCMLHARYMVAKHHHLASALRRCFFCFKDCVENRRNSFYASPHTSTPCILHPVFKRCQSTVLMNKFAILWLGHEPPLPLTRLQRSRFRHQNRVAELQPAFLLPPAVPPTAVMIKANHHHRQRGSEVELGTISVADCCHCVCGSERFLHSRPKEVNSAK